MPTPTTHPYTLSYALIVEKQTELLEAMRQLDLMSAEYGKAKASYDAHRRARGESFEENPVVYQNEKANRVQLGYWYSKVEHWQRQVAALGAFLTGIATTHQILYPNARQGVPVAREATPGS